MKIIERFRRWCARPYIALAQAKFDLDLSLANLQAQQERLQLMCAHARECPLAYEQGHFHGRQQVIADLQDMIDARRDVSPNQDDLDRLRRLH